MSEVDIRKRLNKYGAGGPESKEFWLTPQIMPEFADVFDIFGTGNFDIERIALVKSDTGNLPSFPASDKGPKGGRQGDPRYKWFVENYGDRCWELDAMSPNDLRERVEENVERFIPKGDWRKFQRTEKPMQKSVADFSKRLAKLKIKKVE